MDRAPPKRIEQMAHVLTALSAAMADQAEFFTDPMVRFGVENVAEGAALAKKRLASSVSAETNQMQAMQKTLLVELTRALLTTTTVLQNAAAEGWPDLTRLLAEGQALLCSTAEEDPGLFWPAGVAPDVLRQSKTDAPFGTPEDWKGSSDGYFRLRGDGILLSALPVRGGKGRSWMARVGGTGVALCATPDLAAVAASAAYGCLFTSGQPSAMPTLDAGQGPLAAL